MHYRIAADTIFVLHAAIFLFNVFGWAIATLWWPYMTVLVLTLLYDTIFDYCVLSKWEFDLRKKINPSLRYDYNWATYYTYRLTNRHISNPFFKKISILFLTVSIGINLYFKFLYT